MVKISLCFIFFVFLLSVNLYAQISPPDTVYQPNDTAQLNKYILHINKGYEILNLFKTKNYKEIKKLYFSMNVYRRILIKDFMSDANRFIMEYGIPDKNKLIITSKKIIYPEMSNELSKAKVNFTDLHFIFSHENNINNSNEIIVTFRDNSNLKIVDIFIVNKDKITILPPCP